MMGKAGITKPIKIQSFTVAGVLEAIEAAESKYGKKGSDLTVIIQGDNNANYNDFKLVINALKQKEMFKFKVSTDPIQIN